MKPLLLIALCALVLAGCAPAKPTASASPPATSPTATTASPTTPPAKTFADSQMVGTYKAQVGFSPGFPKNKMAMVVKAIGNTYLQLKPNDRFAMGGEKGTLTGIWTIKGQNLYLEAQARNDIPIAKIIQDLKAKGASTKAYEHLTTPAMFKISDDGSQLMSPTPTTDVVVVLKRSPK